MVRGVVQDEKGVPIQGASIIITGTRRGTVSNSSGEFLIDVQAGQSLSITAVGYEPQQVPVEKEGRLLIKLKILEATEENVVINTGLFPAERKVLRAPLQLLAATN
ncbi:carboxypeptidase-like regulatory domain-containing protein [Niabella sp. W65]|nr:carboxypeptidase-like regulatory domain-containing protein [Niabella sp. W65]MCH7365349.1 carboxypeptidase-like regulatory domain-containing protein [Niabella sp. W65]ULT41145.1 carboxypeptidase-like regulatory domain-containing protein [Niabella sp. I65]